MGEDPGAAALHDLGLLDVTYAMYAGYFHALALLSSQGVRPSGFTELLVAWLRALLALLPDFAAEIEARNYRNAVSNVALNHAAVGNILEVSRARGVPADDVLGGFEARLAERVNDGHGGESFASVYEAIREHSHPKA